MLTLIWGSLALAGPAGGYRISGDSAPLLADVRVAAALNPGDEQVLGAFARAEVHGGSLALNVTSGYTTALYQGAAVDGGLGMTQAGLYYLLDSDRGWASRVGVEGGFAPDQSRAFATVQSESTGGTLFQLVAQTSRTGDKGELAMRAGTGFYQSAAMEADGVSGTITFSGALFGARALSERVRVGGELEVLPLEKSWAQLRPLVRFQPAGGVALDLGLQVPFFLFYEASPFSAATVLFKVSTWRASP